MGCRTKNWSSTVSEALSKATLTYCSAKVKCGVANGNFVTFLENVAFVHHASRRLEYGDGSDPVI